MEHAAYPDLFSPFMLAGKQLRNRIAHTSITTRFAAKSAVTDRLIEHTVTRARGGTAVFITEPLAMARHQLAPTRICCWNDDQVDGLKRWADAVEREDCRLVGQIQDPGRGRHVAGRNPDAIGASALPDDLSWTVPHALTATEIKSLIEDFAQSSARLKRCGFSGVEISAGHGHLFHQFLSPWSNGRDDAYGGDFERRMRFMIELVDAVRGACGSDFILGLKLPGDDGIKGSIGPELSARIAARLTASGKADYVALAQGTHNRTLEMHAPDGHFPPMSYLPLYRQIRLSMPDVPMMALGRITDPAEADGIIARGDAQLIGLGRPLLTDAMWPMKSAGGHARDIRYCVSGNKCWANSTSQNFLACENNPRLAAGTESKPPHRAARKHRIVVVGSGVAGLEAALAAAQRGHEVTVIGRSGSAGGKTRLHAQLPGCEQMSSIYDYQFVAAQHEGVRFELGFDATAADIIAMQPDTVVLATGSTMIWPPCLPRDLQEQNLVPDLRTAMGEIIDRPGRQHGTAVIFDMDATEGTYAAAELLHQRFQSLVLITPRESIAQDMSLLARQGILRRFHSQGIAHVLLSEPRWTPAFETESRLDYEHLYSGALSSIADVGFFAYATPRIPNDALAQPLRDAGIDVRLAGDCRLAKDALAATADGYAVGSAI